MLELRAEKKKLSKMCTFF